MHKTIRLQEVIWTTNQPTIRKKYNSLHSLKKKIEERPKTTYHSFQPMLIWWSPKVNIYFTYQKFCFIFFSYGINITIGSKILGYFWVDDNMKINSDN